MTDKEIQQPDNLPSQLPSQFMNLDSMVSKHIPFRSLEDVINDDTTEVVIEIIDNGNVENNENIAQLFISEIQSAFGEKVKVSLHSGKVPLEMFNDKEIVLSVYQDGCIVLKAKGVGDIKDWYIPSANYISTLNNYLVKKDHVSTIFHVQPHEIFDKEDLSIAFIFKPGNILEADEIQKQICNVISKSEFPIKEQRIVNPTYPINHEEYKARINCDIVLEYLSNNTWRVSKKRGYILRSDVLNVLDF